MANPLTPPQSRRPPKVSVIGAGMVGSALAYSLIVERVAGEVVLVDVNRNRAEGEAIDINHAVPFSSPTRVMAGDYADCRHSDVVVITAGVAQKPGETRLDLLARNVNIYRDIIPRLTDVAANAILLIVSNPVDILTYAAVKLSGLPWQRVIGSGTVLDTARFRYELGAHCQVDPRNVHAYILGEHGDSEVPIWSLANIAGIPFPRFCETCHRGCPPGEFDRMFQRVKNAAYEIIKLKGATYFAIALGATRMVEAILRNQNTVMTASVLMQGQHGLSDVCLSLPVAIGSGGATRVLEMSISGEERMALLNSAQVLRGTLTKVGF